MKNRTTKKQTGKQLRLLARLYKIEDEKVIKTRKKEKTKIFFKKGLTNAHEFGIITKSQDAGMAQSVEHVIGNDEVISSILITSSNKATQSGCFIFFILLDIFQQIML